MQKFNVWESAEKSYPVECAAFNYSYVLYLNNIGIHTLYILYSYITYSSV